MPVDHPPLPPTEPSPPSSLLRQTRSVVGGVAHGLSSVAKTSVLRRDRVSDAFYRTRLDICKGCPGGHAKFHKNGSLSTCGPMLKSLRDEGQQTCGCVLSKKALDVKESCPFGYWPTLDGAALLPEISGTDRESLSRVAQIPGVPGLAYDLLTRRHFIGTALGALATAFVVRPSWASEDDACYVTLAACGPSGQSGAYTDCSAVEGWELGKVYEGSDGECYTLSESPPSSQAGANQVTLLAGAKEDCQECEEDNNPDPGNPTCVIAGNQFYENSRVSVVFNGSVVKADVDDDDIVVEKAIEWVNNQMGAIYNMSSCGCGIFRTERFLFEHSPDEPFDRNFYYGQIYTVYDGKWTVGFNGIGYESYSVDGTAGSTELPGTPGDCSIIGGVGYENGGFEFEAEDVGGVNASVGYSGPLLDGIGIGTGINYEISVSVEMQTQHID